MFRRKCLEDDEIIKLINDGYDSEIEDLIDEDMNELNIVEGKILFFVHNVKAVLDPLQDVRYDKKNHLPEFQDRKNNMRCKNPECNAKTFVVCSKCQVPLCVARGKNCFLQFHVK